MQMPLSILGSGLVTSVGWNALSSCAAMRAKLSNPAETRFMAANGEWVLGHHVNLADGALGMEKLVQMAALAIEESMQGVSRAAWSAVPLMLCVAEPRRAGRPPHLESTLGARLRASLGASFPAGSATFSHGRVGVAAALQRARTMIQQGQAQQVLVAGVDSLLDWLAMSGFERQGRLLTTSNSNGFMPGEAAGALRVGPATPGSASLRCTGIGFGHEAAHIDSDVPLRAQGLCRAIDAALKESGLAIHDMDLRISDVSGEHYYFKEAALAVGRLLRESKDDFDLWHPAECIGEVGAAAGLAMIAMAEQACRKAYAKGSRILAHLANDTGERAALSLEYVGPR